MNRTIAVKAISAAFFLTSVLTLTPAFADSTSGTVVAYDRVAGLLVMKDKSIFSLDSAVMEVPPSLSAGDRISIDFEGDEDGIRQINAITIVTEGDES